jgi:hypothetical protein
MKSYEIISASHKTPVIKDAPFWAQKKPSERIEAVEILREQRMKMNNEDFKRFRRVLQIVERKRS